MQDYQHLHHEFPPVYDSNSKILILGSFPSVKSREQQFYYGHPQNRFWKVLAAVTADSVPQTIVEGAEDIDLQTDVGEAEGIDFRTIVGEAEDIDFRTIVGEAEGIDFRTIVGEAEDIDFRTIVGEAEDIDSKKIAVAAKDIDLQMVAGKTEDIDSKTIARVSEVAVPKTIAEKKKFQLCHKIALWDVIEECEIIGSSDSSIRNVVPVDIAVILRQAPIQKIFANGTKAYELYQKYLLPVTGLPCEKLPSTSPANAAYSLERLTECWRKIREL